MPCVTSETAAAYLNGGIGDADGVEYLAEVIRDEAVTGPLGEEGDGNDNAQTTSVSWVHEERLVTNVGDNYYRALV